ncbi:MAG: hypothetical protein IKT14_04730 [Clostridiales bacterium]|nr:hypothetical protein [Clostridiales bacterium]MBR6484302.1 hypothetical protein [Clostridiales bacterium]
MFSRFFKGRGWNLFCSFYMLAIIAYIIFFAVVHHIFMVGFLISTIFMFFIELWIFAVRGSNVV